VVLKQFNQIPYLLHGALIKQLKLLTFLQNFLVTKSVMPGVCQKR